MLSTLTFSKILSFGKELKETLKNKYMCVKQYMVQNECNKLVSKNKTLTLTL